MDTASCLAVAAGWAIVRPPWKDRRHRSLVAKAAASSWNLNSMRPFQTESAESVQTVARPGLIIAISWHGGHKASMASVSVASKSGAEESARMSSSHMKVRRSFVSHLS